MTVLPPGKTLGAARPSAAGSLGDEPAAIAGTEPKPDNVSMPLHLIDFASPASVARWSAIDDVVMGGISHSRLDHDPAGHGVFAGVVSLERNGGFASVRSPVLDLGAPGATAYVLEVHGDGRRYKINLRSDDAFDGVNYQAAFVAPALAWTRISLPLGEFRPGFRGRPVPDAPPLDPARVRQIGLMIADRQAGPFALAIRSISAA
jgi:NADH dehydrogenase [ubiquinone] 1 alpha subcomplex assembly factor 1